MNYHIDTGLIYEKFSVPCDCPLCEIEAVAEKQFIYEFTNDAVMDDSARKKVNEKGFCRTHYNALYVGGNKLSLALQLLTRIDRAEAKNICKIDKPKDKVKQLAFIKEASCTCAICDALDESMEKYYKTIAEMFRGEKDFPAILRKTKGFCNKHYAKLLEFSRYAGLKEKEYLTAVSGIQAESLTRLLSNLNLFCDSRDYRNAYKPMGEEKNALPQAAAKLYGTKKQ